MQPRTTGPPKAKGNVRQKSGRTAERVKAELAVSLEGAGQAVARNVSESGIYFETDAALKPGSPIRFTIRFDNAGKPFRASCVGEIVRVEKARGKVGVGARIIEAKLEMESV